MTQSIFQFLSNHFELISYIYFGFLFIIALAFVMVKIKEVGYLKQVTLLTNRTLLVGVVLGQMLLIGLLYWSNYKLERKTIVVEEDIEYGSTKWVRSKTVVYYVQGKHLRSIYLNGKNRKDIFTAPQVIKEINFSPDGRYLLILSMNDLHLLDIETKHVKRINSVDIDQNQEDSNKRRGVISGLRWSPDSLKFCYELARWSEYSQQDDLFLYDLPTQKSRKIKSPTRRISSLYWDEKGSSLYFLRHEMKTSDLKLSAYEVYVFQISLDTLEFKKVLQLPTETADLPLVSLDLRGIKLFRDSDHFAFKRIVEKNVYLTKKGPFVGIDEKDHVYYVGNKWFRKRIFKIARKPSKNAAKQYQYKGGDLTIRQIRWTPDEKYLVMDHVDLGILVLEPIMGRVGRLVDIGGDIFGWHPNHL